VDVEEDANESAATAEVEYCSRLRLYWMMCKEKRLRPPMLAEARLATPRLSLP
jgi:hypothetical protein